MPNVKLSNFHKTKVRKAKVRNPNAQMDIVIELGMKGNGKQLPSFCKEGKTSVAARQLMLGWCDIFLSGPPLNLLRSWGLAIVGILDFVGVMACLTPILLIPKLRFGNVHSSGWCDHNPGMHLEVLRFA